MIEFDCEEVKRQLNRLASGFPADRVDIWLKAEVATEHSPRRVEYTVYINDRDDLGSECACGETLFPLIEEILLKRDARNAKWIKTRRELIDKKRAELAKLESELDPLVMAMDKAQCEKRNEMDDAMSRRILCKSCGDKWKPHPQHVRDGWQYRAVFLTVKKPDGHGVTVIADGKATRHDLPSVQCDTCGESVADGSICLAVTMWRGGLVLPWEHECGVVIPAEAAKMAQKLSEEKP